ncbi:MAG: hypothetical protein J6I45_06155 [Clostridia bacterium]|nr:hypothetical protein [Clostridia bacterium]
MKRNKFLLFLALLFLLSGCAGQETSLGVELEDGVELAYKYGEITITDEVWYEEDIYTERFPDNTVHYMGSLNISEKRVLYGRNASLIAFNESTDIISTCMDPLCGHMPPGICIASYRPGRMVQFDENIYFGKANGIYRYSLETLKITPFAVFNSGVGSLLFSMGRFLYATFPGQIIAKIDMETLMAAFIKLEEFEPHQVIPYEGALYCSDYLGNIYSYDQNFENKTLLVKGTTPACFTDSSYQVWDGKLCYVTTTGEYHPENSEDYLLCVLDLDTGDTKTYKNIYCFTISGDTIYFQRYEPQTGPLYYNDDSYLMETSLSRTGNTIYTAPLNDIGSARTLTRFDMEDAQLMGYSLHAAGNYLYTMPNVYDNGDISVPLCRYNLATGEWQTVE